MHKLFITITITLFYIYIIIIIHLFTSIFFLFSSLTGQIKHELRNSFTIKYGLFQENKNHSGCNC